MPTSVCEVRCIQASADLLMTANDTAGTLTAKSRSHTGSTSGLYTYFEITTARTAVAAHAEGFCSCLSRFYITFHDDVKDSDENSGGAQQRETSVSGLLERMNCSSSGAGADSTGQRDRAVEDGHLNHATGCGRTVAGHASAAGLAVSSPNDAPAEACCEWPLHLSPLPPHAQEQPGADAPYRAADLTVWVQQLIITMVRDQSRPAHQQEP